ncbi:MAG: tetratricopeptide repeat protein [Bacteroidota bacterium]
MMESLPQNIMDDYELIRKYFDFELNEKELAAVNERMEADEAFLERMRIFQTSDEEILNLEQTNIAKEEAKTVTLKPKPKQRRITPVRLRAIAAVLFFVIASVFVFQIFFNTNNSLNILAQNYWEESEQLIFSNLRSDNAPTATKTKLVAASNSFQQKDFQTALNTLSSIPSADELYHKAALLKGEIYLEQKQFQAAVDQFQIVIEHPNNEHNDYAYWYQALAYLQLEQVEEAKQNLDYILEQRYSIPNVEKLRVQLEN